MLYFYRLIKFGIDYPDDTRWTVEYIGNGQYRGVNQDGKALVIEASNAAAASIEFGNRGGKITNLAALYADEDRHRPSLNVRVTTWSVP
jgi:Tol biopolymer transport system component